MNDQGARDALRERHPVSSDTPVCIAWLYLLYEFRLKMKSSHKAHHPAHTSRMIDEIDREITRLSGSGMML